MVTAIIVHGICLGIGLSNCLTEQKSIYNKNFIDKVKGIEYMSAYFAFGYNFL